MTSQPANEPATKKGRPLEDGLRNRLLDHTIRVLLLRDGYQKFSMNAVAQSAKASKETLYRQFGDKAGMLHAALTRNATLIGPLLNEGLQASANHGGETVLAWHLTILRAANLPEALALQRIAYADGKRGSRANICRRNHRTRHCLHC
jgi:AcrR family transcriptional regulator